jgi:hypothetical protein
MPPPEGSLSTPSGRDPGRRDARRRDTRRAARGTTTHQPIGASSWAGVSVLRGPSRSNRTRGSTGSFSTGMGPNRARRSPSFAPWQFERNVKATFYPRPIP